MCSVGSWRQELDCTFDALAFDNRVDGVGGNISQRLDATIGPADFHFVHYGIARQSEMQPRIIGGKIAGAGFDFFDLRPRG